MKQKRAGGWGYYFIAGVAVLARNRTAGCMLVEVHPASVLFSALVQIVGCMLERVHPAVSSARADVLGGGGLSYEVGVHVNAEKPRDVVGNEFVQTFCCFHFRISGVEGDAVSKVSRYGGTASCDKFMI